MTSKFEPSCRLYVILARDGRSAVVLRRGPSKQVQLIRWWLETDTFEEGQWFKGRIYEMRCDLSPNGEKFAYFAQDFGRPLGSWTAISKPPYLTALALWPKGDCWGGGALFDSENMLRLNHRPGAESKLHPDFKLPKRVSIKPLGEHSGWGEDDPISYYRLIRDGWRWAQQGHSERANAAATVSYPYNPVEIYAKPRPATSPVELLQITHGVGVRNGPWYKMDFAVVKQGGFTFGETRDVPGIQRDALLYLETCSWADWAANGDLLYALDGCLYRLKAGPRTTSAREWRAEPIELADFRANRFTPMPPSEEAMRW